MAKSSGLIVLTCPACGAGREVAASARTGTLRCLTCGHSLPSPSEETNPPSRATEAVSDPIESIWGHQLSDSFRERYVLDRPIGEGAMGIVFHGRQVVLDREVAIKFVKVADATTCERFARESKLLAKLQHPGIVQVYDGGLEHGFPYLVLEFVEGLTLKEYLTERGRLAPDQALRILISIADALECAHAQTIVHRDLKLANILMAGRRDPKITDFGLAKSLSGSNQGRTHDGAIMGTPAYMSPEQARGSSVVDHRTDIYSCGVMLFELLTGQVPFISTDLFQILKMHVENTPPPLGAFLTGVDLELQDVVDTALEKDPADRYPTAAALAVALRHCVAVMFPGADLERPEDLRAGSGRRLTESIAVPRASARTAPANLPGDDRPRTRQTGRTPALPPDALPRTGQTGRIPALPASARPGADSGNRAGVLPDAALTCPRCGSPKHSGALVCDECQRRAYESAERKGGSGGGVAADSGSGDVLSTQSASAEAYRTQTAAVVDSLPGSAAEGSSAGQQGRVPPSFSQELLKKYEYIEFIGAGKMGQVHKVRHRTLHRLDAVKIVGGEQISPSEARKLVREAQALAQVKHKAILTIYDASEDESGPYIICEFVDGGTLRDQLRSSAPMPVMDAVTIIDQVLEGLGAAHENGIVHRDLKPENIFLTSRGEPKIGDFGLARVAQHPSDSIPGSIVGTPYYMSPEQVRGEDTTPSTDIYAVGIILFEMLAGQLPFRGNNTQAVFQDQLNKAPPSIRSLRSEVPAELDEVVSRALRKDPSKRFKSAKDFREALQPAVQRLKGAPGAAHEGSRQSWTQPLAGVAVAACVLGAAWVVGIGRPAVPPLPTSSPPTSRAIAIASGSSASGGGPPTGSPDATTVTVSSDPPGATVRKTDSATVLGRTPWVGHEPAGKVVSYTLKLDGYLQTSVSGTPELGKDLPLQAKLPSAPDAPGEIRGGDGAPMVLIPGGEFLMGDDRYEDERRHKVEVRRFYADKYLVTNRLFSEFVQRTHYRTEAEIEGRGYALSGGKWIDLAGANWQHPDGPSDSIESKMDAPVVQVSWNDAKAYCDWAKKSLPTEAQWERAARGGLEEKPYPWGDSDPKDHAFFDILDGPQPVRVGKLHNANGYGLFDMAGNVAEWCADWYESGYYTQASASVDPKGPDSASTRVVRGGSWLSSSADLLRCADRDADDPSIRTTYIGFRGVTDRQ